MTIQGPAAGYGNVRINAFGRVEVRQTLLSVQYLLSLIERQEIGVRFLQSEKRLIATFDGDGKIGTILEEVQDDLIGQAVRNCFHRRRPAFPAGDRAPTETLSN